MIIVTGGAGFIGSNLVQGLNQRGNDDILVVDHLQNGRKMHNLADLNISDYLDREDFLDRVRAGDGFGNITAIFHQGACSATTEWDGRYLMANNYAYSKELLHWCLQRHVPFIYASSAAVYGDGRRGFREEQGCERPINMYAYSKLQFDQYVRRVLPTARSPIVGLRYFNVYGPREAHKGPMASTVHHFNQQLQETGAAQLFSGSDDYAAGEQRRDFVYVEDCVNVNFWFLDNPQHSGIFNCGTGQAQTFNELAQAVIDWHGQGHIEYIPFPEHLQGAYQSFTEAALERLRQVGYEREFVRVQEGVNRYLSTLSTST